MIRGTASEALESAQSSAHGWAIASAMKTLGHVERLRGSSERAVDFYERALAYATAVTKNAVAGRDGVEHHRCGHKGGRVSRLVADVRDDGCDFRGGNVRSARAVSEAEALGDEKHPRVGVCIAAAPYVAKALRSSVNAAEGELGDGAGIMFAEGLYKSALKLMHYPHIVEDAYIVLDYEARHLCALLHAAILEHTPRVWSTARARGGRVAHERENTLA